MSTARQDRKLPTSNLPSRIDPEDLARLRWATEHLEHPSLAARLSSLVGTPIDIAIRLLPRPVYKRTRQMADVAVWKVFKAATSSLRHQAESNPRNRMYRTLAGSVGAVGGLFGVYGLPFELPVSTTIMLRSIAEIARAEGEHIQSHDTQLACLQVFALGGQSETDDAAETGYYGVRLALAWASTHAMHHVMRHGVDAGGPTLVRLLSAISSRFGVALTQKAAAQLVPVIGAASGAAINVLFMSHFQEMARGHFVVRRLERKYGQELVQANYEQIRLGA
jgi:hypothetical protein